MAQFESFPRQTKDNGMLAGTIGDPEGMDRDLTGPRLEIRARVVADEPAVRLPWPANSAKRRAVPLGASFLVL